MTSDSAIRVAVIEPVGGHGGMDYYDFGLCGGLKKAGVEPVLYTCDETAWREAAFRASLFFRGIYGADPKAARAARFIRGLLRSLADARSSGARIAHFHFFHTTGLEWLCLRAARLFGMKTVVTVHDVESFSAGSTEGFARRIYGAAGLLIVHNRVSAGAIAALSPELSRKTVIIPHGNYLDSVEGGIGKAEALERLGLGDGDGGPLLLFWGQIKEVKGLDILLDALPEVARKIPSVRLLIAGKVWKDDFARYEETIRRHGLGPRVTSHVRYIPGDLVKYYYAAADMVVLPYRKIYQSGVLLMAMSYGRPVTVSDLPGMTEVVDDGRTGFVFKSNDPASLAATIVKALSDPALMGRVAREGRLKMETEYGWSDIGSKTAGAYRALLSGGAPR